MKKQVIAIATACAVLTGYATNTSGLNTIQISDFSLDAGTEYHHASGHWQIELVSNISDMNDLQQPNGVNENQTFSFRSRTLSDGHWKITEASLTPYTGSSSGESNFNNNASALESYAQGGARRHTIVAARNDYWDLNASSQFTAVNELATGEDLVGVIYDLNYYKILNHDFGITSLTIQISGDFDLDGDLDGDDFLLWQRNFPILDGTAHSSNGDANGDGNVDGDDFLIWQSNFPFPASITSVPEPTALVLFAIGGLLIFRRYHM